jgi:hypothetical protein
MIMKNESKGYRKTRIKLYVAVFVVLDSKRTKMCSNMTVCETRQAMYEYV